MFSPCARFDRPLTQFPVPNSEAEQADVQSRSDFHEQMWRCLGSEQFTPATLNETMIIVRHVCEFSCPAAASASAQEILDRRLESNT